MGMIKEFLEALKAEPWVETPPKTCGEGETSFYEAFEDYVDFYRDVKGYTRILNLVQGRMNTEHFAEDMVDLLRGRSRPKMPESMEGTHPNVLEDVPGREDRAGIELPTPVPAAAPPPPPSASVEEVLRAEAECRARGFC